MATVILGVRVDTMTKTEALNQARGFLVSGQHCIFTPNPEMLVKAESDRYFKEVLNRGDLNLCDGFGLWAAVKVESLIVHKVYKVERVAGVDFMLELCRVAAEQGRSVFLLGSGNDEVVNKTKDELLKKFPNLKIVGVDKGIEIKEIRDRRYAIGEIAEPDNIAYRLSPMQLEYPREPNDTLIARINAANPDILFVAFGMGKQEKWIVENVPKMPSVKIAMGVGGSFDYISGSIPRAPLLMRKFGLEWLYRLAKQPRRIGRIWNATIGFIWRLAATSLWKNRFRT